jgi:cysteine desulfurase
MRPIYLDHNATTPVDPEVLAAMLPFLREDFGLPSSLHALGRSADNAVESARAEVAALIGAYADEIVFTSGGTEANNMAIRGAMILRADQHAVVTTDIEHPATEECCRSLEREGHPVHRLNASLNGCIDAAAVIEALDGNTALVTIIHAQNDIGTLQPVAEVASLARTRGALVHIDGTQSVGKVRVNVNAIGADLLSISGHKLYAPKGIGALYIRRGVDLPPLLAGAGQERGRRPGTENVASIVALGTACRIAAERLDREQARLADLSLDLLTKLTHAIPGLALVGDPDLRLPNTLTVLFPGASGRQILRACPEILAYAGPAGDPDREEPLAVLGALGISRAAALGAVRLSLGRGTSAADVAIAAASLAAAWRSVRETPRAFIHLVRTSGGKPHRPQGERASTLPATPAAAVDNNDR